MIVVIRATRVEIEVLSKGGKVVTYARCSSATDGYYYDICDLIGLMVCSGGSHDADFRMPLSLLDHYYILYIQSF